MRSRGSRSRATHSRAGAENRAQSLRQLIALQDRERQLLACEIHDGFVQEVVGAQLAIDSLLERLAQTDPEAVETLLRIRGMVRRAIDESRRLVGELRLPPSDGSSLAQAVQSLVHELEARRQMEIGFQHRLTTRALDPLLQATLVRIVQESLNNVFRHAQTRQANVELVEESGKIRVTVTDQGVGFNPRDVSGDHFGLAGIRERARLFGGRAVVRSRPGKGTRVTADFPLAPSTARE